MEKFEPKKTTDDCYTPENIHAVVMDWVAEEYGIDKKDMVRPFWPGASFESREYPKGCVVVDNPPFSILAHIVRWFNQHGVRFFLYAPALTLLGKEGTCSICTSVGIEYANGAQVSTSFLTNLEDAVARTAPELYNRLEAANKANVQAKHKQLPKYSFPNEMVTAAIMGRWCKYGVRFRVLSKDCRFVRKLDAMGSKGIFGGGLLLSSRAAAERAAAERAAAHVWELSERERAEVERLGQHEQ